MIPYRPATEFSVSTADYVDMQAKTFTEKRFQEVVISLAENLGWLVYHTHDSRRSQAGFPDLVLVHQVQRRVLFRELKTMTGTVSPDQKKWLEQLTAAGQDAAVWRPDQWVNRFIVDDELLGGVDL